MDFLLDKTIRGTELTVIGQDFDNGVPTFVHAVDENGIDFPLTNDEINQLKEEIETLFS